MSTTHQLPERASLGGHDTSERLSPDDQATLREEQFLQFARITQMAIAAAAPRSRQGVCSNCGEACMPHVVYCDDDCRTDHQHRESVLKRQGRR